MPSCLAYYTRHQCSFALEQLPASPLAMPAPYVPVPPERPQSSEQAASSAASPFEAQPLRLDRQLVGEEGNAKQSETSSAVGQSDKTFLTICQHVQPVS